MLQILSKHPPLEFHQHSKAGRRRDSDQVDESQLLWTPVNPLAAGGWYTHITCIIHVHRFTLEWQRRALLFLFRDLWSDSVTFWMRRHCGGVSWPGIQENISIKRLQTELPICRQLCIGSLMLRPYRLQKARLHEQPEDRDRLAAWPQGLDYRAATCRSTQQVSVLGKVGTFFGGIFGQVKHEDGDVQKAGK